MEVRKEVHKLLTGHAVLVWVRVNRFMPWMLASIEPLEHHK